MKKYISPIAKEIKISSENLIAVSGEVENKETDERGGSNRRNSIWDDED